MKQARTGALIALFCLTVSGTTGAAQAQQLYLSGKAASAAEQSAPSPLFLKQDGGGRGTTSMPLFLNDYNMKVGQTSVKAYRAHESTLRNTFLKAAQASGNERVMQKAETALALMETDRANIEASLRERERIQQDVQAKLAAFQSEIAAQQAAYTRAGANAAAPGTLPVPAGAEGNPDHAGKKVIRVYAPDSSLEKPRPVFNAVR